MIVKYLEVTSDNISIYRGDASKMIELLKGDILRFKLDYNSVSLLDINRDGEIIDCVLESPRFIRENPPPLMKDICSILELLNGGYFIDLTISIIRNKKINDILD